MSGSDHGAVERVLKIGDIFAGEMRRHGRGAEADAYLADLRFALSRIASLEGALDELLQFEQGIKADLVSAHNARGAGLSQWMREDDAEQRRGFAKACNKARSLLPNVKPDSEEG